MNPEIMSAAARLDQSRAHLRRALQGEADPGERGPGQTAPSGPPTWLARLKGLPGAGLLVGAVEAWWARHPLHLAGVIATTAADAVLRPVAQRHPMRLMLGAAAMGAVLAWSRPWRWMMVPALFAGLVPQLVTAVLRAPQQDVGPPPRG